MQIVGGVTIFPDFYWLLLVTFLVPGFLAVELMEEVSGYDRKVSHWDVIVITGTWGEVVPSSTNSNMRESGR